MTLGQALAARVLRHLFGNIRLRPVSAALAPHDQPHHSAGMTVIDWAAHLRCQDCDGREVDFVISGAAR